MVADDREVVSRWQYFRKKSGDGFCMSGNDTKRNIRATSGIQELFEEPGGEESGSGGGWYLRRNSSVTGR